MDWIRDMLRSRCLEIDWGETSVRGTAPRGCPQGGVLSPLLWCLVVNGLLCKLNEEGYYAQGYADDFLILFGGAHLDPLIGLARTALRQVVLLCDAPGLTVNPEKTDVAVFTIKYKVTEIRGPMFRGKRLQISGSVKYLGVILGRKLSWMEHLEAQCRRFVTTFWLCQRVSGGTWGLWGGGGSRRFKLK